MIATDRRGLLGIGAAGIASLAFPAAATTPLRDVARMPFSWDRVPEFTLATKTSAPFTDAEITMLAQRFSLVTIGNSHAPRTYDGTEAGAIGEGRRIKAVNPSTPVLCYLNSFIDYPTYAATRKRKPDDWYLSGLDGQPYKPRNSFNDHCRWDLTHSEVRDWWVGLAADIITRGELDGVFVDAVPQIAARQDIMAKAVGAEKAEALVGGLQTMLESLRAALGPEKIVIYNGLRTIPGGWSDGGMRFLRHTSGAMIEHFDFGKTGTPERLAGDLETMRETASLGKTVLLKAWPGFSWLDDEAKRPAAELRSAASNALPFRLAAFLITAEPHCYLSYTWGYRENHGTFDSYPLLDRPIGAPLGPAEVDGMLYRRRFQNAVVELDLMARTGVVS